MSCTMLERVFINVNPCCVQWYKFHVCQEFRRFSHTNLPTCTKNHETWLISWANNSISDGDVTTFSHALMSFKSLHYKSHVHRL